MCKNVNLCMMKMVQLCELYLGYENIIQEEIIEESGHVWETTSQEVTMYKSSSKGVQGNCCVEEVGSSQCC